MRAKTPSAVTRLDWGSSGASRTVLGVDEIDRQIELFRLTDGEARRSIVGIQPARAEVILAGACVVRTVMEKLGCSELTVSDRGLRHGLLRERFGLF